MINTLELWKAMLAQLGAEGTRRYTAGRDGIYAINGAMKRFEALATPLLAQRKGSEESLSEIQETRIFQTNTFGGLSLDSIWSSPSAQITYQVWTVVALYYKPLCSQPFTPGVPSSPGPILPGVKTYIRNDLVYQPGGVDELPVQRMTAEQVAVANRNRFMAGNERTAATRPKIGYYIMGNRSDNDFALSGGREVVFTPRSLFVPTPRYIAMSYLRTPDAITTIDDVTNIPYPSSLFVVLRDLALNEISVKMGDGTNLYTVTEREIGRLLGAQN